MSRNLKLFLGATLIFYIIGAENDAAGMYALAAACLAVLLVCYFLTRLLIRGVEVELELHGTRSVVGRDVAATLRVRNPGRIVRAGMSLATRVTNETLGGAAHDQELLLPALPARSRTDLEIHFPCATRGLHRLRDARLIASDPLGIYHRPRPLGVQGAFLVLPRAWESGTVESWELLSPEGRRSARLVERAGGDFMGIRPHVPGDDLRHVHWKVTAHTGGLAMKEYHQRWVGEVTLWLDLCDCEGAWRDADSPGETAVSLAATLLWVFARGDHLISLAGQGLPGYLSLPARGAAYVDQAQVALAEAQPARDAPFSRFCLDRAAHAPRVTSGFAVTAAADGALLEALALHTRRGARISVLLPFDPRVPANETTPESALRHRQQLMARRFAAAGIPAVTVAGFADIPRALGALAGHALRDLATAS